LEILFYITHDLIVRDKMKSERQLLFDGSTCASSS
jgi:hypothetical protein